MSNKDLLMVTVSGPDKPGIAAALTRVMVEHGVEIVDLEQASLQDLLGLSFLLDHPGEASAKDSFIKDLLFEAYRLGLALNFRFISEREVRKISQRHLFVLAFFGGVRAIAELSAILGEEKVNIETVTSLTQPQANLVEMIINVDRTENLGRLKQRLMAKSRELNLDLALQKSETYRKNKRLVFFDMDSTLLDMEVIDELAGRAGVHLEVARITEKAMRGDFDYEESLRQRTALLKGLPEEELADVRDNLRLSAGAKEVVTTLKRMGFKVGVVTGGFDYFAGHLQERLGLDFAFANQLEIKNGLLTGRIQGEVLDGARKARLLNQVTQQEGFLLDQTVAVGDGANDALMLGQAGLGIAYNAKPVLDRAANGALGRSRLMNILYLLGITEEDVARAMEAVPPLTRNSIQEDR
ncbi:MAG: phosphoserine phosphatase SerB [Thermodesulfobacteriota bacterium]